jgi:electron transfer flavoprotein alpha subunit
MFLFQQKMLTKSKVFLKTLVLGQCSQTPHLSKETRQAVTAALAFDPSVTVVLVSSEHPQTGSCKGVSEYFSIPSASSVEKSSFTIAKFIKSQNFSHVLAPNISKFKDCLPRIAGILNCQPVSDVVKVLTSDIFLRPIFAGNAVATVKSKDPIKFLTIRSTSFEPAVIDEQILVDCKALGGEIEEKSTQRCSQVIQAASQTTSAHDRPQLGTADKVVAGGRALKSKENFEKLLHPLADKLKAGIGASRAAVDAGYVSNEYQVGQTGVIVAPELYIAVGISGAVQHLAGMKDAKCIVAINKDADCPIFQVADYGLVGDLFEIIPELTEKL